MAMVRISNSPRIRVISSVLLLLATSLAYAETTLGDIQQQWDTTNFALEGDAQTKSFEQLQATCEAYTEANPSQAEGWIWRGIVDSSFAGAKGGLGALGLAKSARGYLEKAIDIDGDAMQGSAYSSLGTLYYSVPGWPLGFGDNDKAEKMLLKGLQLDPDGIDSNYFYAGFLADQKKPEQALEHYRKALNAPSRDGRSVADEGRRKQIRQAIAELE